MPDAVVSALIGLLGVVLGFLLSTSKELLTNRRTEKKEVESVRLLLRLEIDTNIEALKQFWEQSHSFPDGSTLPEESWEYAPKFIDTPFPRFKREILNSQRHLLAKSLDEQQILDVLKVYDDLDEVEVLKNELEEKKDDIQNVYEHGRATSAGIIIGVEFGDRARTLWPQIENTVSSLLNNGNPLKKYAKGFDRRKTTQMK